MKYLHVRSPIATLSEDLYIRDNSVISLQDSIISFNTMGTTSTIKKSNKAPKKNYFISKIDAKVNREFFLTGRIDDDEYFIYDEVPAVKWQIDESNTRKIAGYRCIKATATIRGSKFTAYFAADLKYSAGPYKFYGLPGLILDIREDNSNSNMWKAEKIEINSSKEINYNPVFSEITKITMRKFVEAKESRNNFELKKLNSNLPPGTRIETNNRLGTEKKYEWE
ncbi:GLPGLI family protein [Kaistella sp. PBT33-4]|uniref:GLPGLI family protein n=1 Tax=Kaistella sp. PBT33-4 TaxID=3032000 RepID=UPI0023D7D846|nr:GLPGLI family protein [Kaistella sp. PBT33-4]MDF0719780.1 GLPGLI family protein [Kaistella sp. PBT33-4]